MIGVLFFAAFVTSLEEGFVITPFGVRRKECVLDVPHNAVVEPVGTKLRIKDGPHISYHTPDARCSDDIADILEKYKARRGDPNNRKRNVEDNQGWLDYAGWYPPNGENNLQTFTSTYVVPGNPIDTSDGQVLFYFIGFQDNDDPGSVNIVQPVLTWGNGFTKWYAKSWACCPSNITVSSPPVFGLQPGSQLRGIITRASPSTWSITSTVVSTGQKTILNAQVGDYQYNWADVTLEVYSISSCQDFAPGKAYFNKLVMLDNQGQQLNPSWTMTPTSECGGQIQQVSSSSIYIQHSPN